MSVSIPKKILLTGAKTFITLDLARRLYAAGHSVFVVETSVMHCCKFSNAVEKSFVVPSPRFDSENYISALVNIVRDYHIDLVIPVFEEIIYISRALDQFPKSCKVLCENFEVLHALHNKWMFNQKLMQLGIDAPKTFLIRDVRELKHIHLPTPYALKACYSRASQSLYKVDDLEALNDLTIESYNPWIAQEWIEGEKYCSYAICRDGEIQAHAVYPVRFSLSGKSFETLSCLTFEAIEHPGIFEWVKNFVKKENFSGQIAFDFIESMDKKLYAIECNPRATHGLFLLTSQDDIVDVFLGTNSNMLVPEVGMSKQIATAMIMYGWRSTGSISAFFKNLFSMPDVIYSRKDLKPFLFQPLLFLFYTYESLKLRKNFAAVFTHDVDWNGDGSMEKFPHSHK